MTGSDGSWEAQMGHGETKMRLQEARRLEASRPNSHLRPARSNPCSPRPHPSLMRHKPSLPRPSQASQGSIKPLKAQSSLPRLNQASQGYIKPPKAQSCLPRLNQVYQGPSGTSQGLHLNLHTQRAISECPEAPSEHPEK